MITGSSLSNTSWEARYGEVSCGDAPRELDHNFALSAASTDLKSRLDGLLVARSALGAKDTYWFETTNALGVAERVTFKADQAYALPTNARTAITSLGISSLTLGASKHYFFVKDGVPYNSRHNGLQKMIDQVGLGRKVTVWVLCMTSRRDNA